MKIRQLCFPVFLILTFHLLVFPACAEPAKDIKDYYKRLLSALQVQQYKYDQEIGKTTFTTLEEEEQYKKGLFKGVKITVTMETRELLDAYLENIKTEDETAADAGALKNELYSRYRIQDKLCFLILVDNTSNIYNYLEISSVPENVILQLQGGKEYSVTDYDKEISGMLQRKTSGLACFPKLDSKGNFILPENAKWFKLKIVRIFPFDSKFVFRGPTDFEFLFDYGKFTKILQEGYLKPDESGAEKAPDKSVPTAEAKTDSVQMGLSAVKEGALDKAIEHFKDAVEASPEDVSLYVLLGSVYLKKNLYDAAISTYKTAVELNPSSPLVHYHLGMAYREKKEFEKAVVELKQAVAAQEDYKEAYFLLGETFVVLNDAENAKKAYEKVLEIEPSHERARLALEKLKQK